MQVRWLHYDESKKKFSPVLQKNGAADTDEDSLKLEDLVKKASSLSLRQENSR